MNMLGNLDGSMNNLLQQLLRKKRAGGEPMQYDPGAMRQFTPSPAPDVPFMPAPQVGPQQIPTGFGGPQGGIGGLGGGPNIGPGMPPQMPGGPNIGPGMPPQQMPGPGPVPLGGTGQQTQRQLLNPQVAQYAMQLLQRSRGTPMQMNPMQMLRGGR